MPTDEDAVDEPAASTAPRYNLMDRDVQPPGYNVYREKKESFTDCIWHCYPAECCMCLLRHEGKRWLPRRLSWHDKCPAVHLLHICALRTLLPGSPLAVLRHWRMWRDESVLPNARRDIH